VGFGRFVRGEHARIVVLNDGGWPADGWPTDRMQWLRGYRGLHFEAMFRHFVFGLDDSAEHALPVRPSAEDAVSELFERHALTPGRTVVLSPYANTLFDRPDDLFWERVVEACRARGLTPVTNCAGDEQPLPGTAAISVPLEQVVAFLDRAGHFVGVRSGLCDVISGSTCRKVVLYDAGGRFFKASFREYFSLRAMGLDPDAIELEYRRGDQAAVIAGIEQALC
jgi:hypothetical protein